MHSLATTADITDGSIINLQMTGTDTDIANPQWISYKPDSSIGSALTVTATITKSDTLTYDGKSAYKNGVKVPSTGSLCAFKGGHITVGSDYGRVQYRYFPDKTIGSGDGMEFGERTKSLIADVNNPGDVDCGMRIVFAALGTLTNPQILNVDTRKYFKINKTMEAGETIEVNTKFGEKSVTGTLNGTESNYWNYADLPGSTFLQLQPGGNPLRYNADSGIDNLNVTIRFTPQYLGV